MDADRKAAGLGESTVINFERSKLLVAAESITKMQLALEDAGIEFTDGKRPEMTAQPTSRAFSPDCSDCGRPGRR